MAKKPQYNPPTNKMYFSEYHDRGRIEGKEISQFLNKHGLQINEFHIEITDGWDYDMYNVQFCGGRNVIQSDIDTYDSQYKKDVADWEASEADKKARAKAQRKLREQEEIAQYERLKKKFEKKVSS